MISEDSVIIDELKKIRLNYGLRRLGDDIPPSVSYLLGALQSTVDLDKKAELTSLLVSEYLLYDMSQEYDTTLRERVDLFPNRIEFLISLAHHLSRSAESKSYSYQLMRSSINLALEQQPSMVGYAYNELARFAVRERDSKLLNEAVLFLLDHTFKDDELEYDFAFLENLPKEAINPFLVKSLLNKLKHHQDN